MRRALDLQEKCCQLVTDRDVGFFVSEHNVAARIELIARNVGLVRYVLASLIECAHSIGSFGWGNRSRRSSTADL